MLAKMSQQITEGLAALLTVPPVELTRRLDVAAFRYGLATRVERFVFRERNRLRAELLTMMPPRASRLLQERISAVEENCVSEQLPLCHGAHYDVQAKVTIGASYIDLDALREALGVSTKRFDAALGKARRRQSPSLTIEVLER